jgi:hypothetical protein
MPAGVGMVKDRVSGDMIRVFHSVNTFGIGVSLNRRKPLRRRHPDCHPHLTPECGGPLVAVIGHCYAQDEMTLAARPLSSIERGFGYEVFQPALSRRCHRGPLVFVPGRVDSARTS